MLWATGCAGASRVPVDDARACGNTTVTLAESARDFTLSLPADATRVRFWADGGGRGEVYMTLRFQTTPDGLDRFLSGSGLPAPAPYGEATPPWLDDSSPAAPRWTGGQPSCGLAAGFHFSDVGNQEDGQKGNVRSFGIDRSDPKHPQVLLVAGDL